MTKPCGGHGRAVDRVAAELARTEAPVVIRGRSDLGKLRLARRIHELSDHRAAPFVPIDALRSPADGAALAAAAQAPGRPWAGAGPT
ncbi:sigma 54-interacting transcriptional regulator, partial [Rhodobacter calidifons]